MSTNRVKECFSSFIKTFDVFTSPVCLRYEKQPMYDTFTGGCFSIAMIVILISVFFNQWVDILNYAVIFSNQQVVREFDPSKLLTNSNQFMFALGVNNLDLNSNDTQYVSVIAETVWKDQNRNEFQKIIPLQKCRTDHWNNFGEQFTSTFTRMGLQTFVCPPKNYTMHFEGKYTSANFAYMKISFKKCSGSKCKTSTQFNDYIAKNTAFFFNVYYVNTLLNKDQIVTTESVFEDKTYLMTSTQLGINLNIYLSEFQITTDQTLWPWTDNQVQKGIIVNKNDHEQWNYIPSGSTMTKVYLRKSDNKIYINRSFRKIDDILSYIGGLFGIIAVVVSVLMTYYSQCSYQLALSSSIFQYKEDQENQNRGPDDHSNGRDVKDQSINRKDIQQSSGPVYPDKNNPNNQKSKAKDNNSMKQQSNPSDFHFFDYLKYLIFILLKQIGCKPKWKKMIMYDDTLSEMRNQMNINTLFQKVSFFDKAIHTLFDEEQLKLLYLQEKYNILDIKKDREMMNMGLDILNMFLDNGQHQNESNLNQSKLGSPNEMNFETSKIELKSRNNLLKSSKSIKRITASPFDMLINALSKQERSKTDIPQDIENALNALSRKISEGDQISKRIYQGLDPILIDKYQKREKDTKQRLPQIKYQGKYAEKQSSNHRKSRRASSFLNLLGSRKPLQVANQF